MREKERNCPSCAKRTKREERRKWKRTVRNSGREKEVFGVAREPSRFGWNVSIERSTLASGLTYNTSTVSREYSVEKWNSPAPFASFCLTIPNCLNFSLCLASKVKSPPIRWKRPSNIVPPPTTPTSLSFTRPPCVVQMFLWNRIFFYRFSSNQRHAANERGVYVVYSRSLPLLPFRRGERTNDICEGRIKGRQFDKSKRERRSEK